MPTFSFRKDEILRKKKLIERLFVEGHSFYLYPFKIQYLIVPLESQIPAQVMFVVGKRAFKLAVDRNRTRRQVREAYRLNKYILYETLEKHKQQIVLAIIFTARKHMVYHDVEAKIKDAILRLIQELGSNAEHSSANFV